MHVELPQSNSDFGSDERPQGQRCSTGRRSSARSPSASEVFPWENRETFQRLALDFKLRGSYHSPGRDYSELFDALGSSQAATLAEPEPGRVPGRRHDGSSSVADPNAAQVFFTGITDQQAYGSFGGSAGVTCQAGEYVKFTAGLGLTYVAEPPHHRGRRVQPGLQGRRRRSRAVPIGAQRGRRRTGIPNPNHRQVIDLPGRRFSVDDTTIVDLWLSGVVMF